MVITISSSVISGYSGVPIKIELDISRGFPKFLFVGLADTMIKESKERVRVVLESHGYKMPHKKVTVNFVPANVKKIGSHLDLAIAIALAGVISLKEEKSKHIEMKEEIGVFGELNLNGDVIEVKEIIPLLVSLQERGVRKFIVPKKNIESAKLLKGIEVIGVNNIFEAIFAYFECDLEWLRKIMEANPIFATWRLHPKTILPKSVICKGEYKIPNHYDDDFAQVLGQKIGRRACEISVSGMHNLLMMGSPGCGKSMLAKRMISIMPELSYEEVIELTKIYSVSNIKTNDPIITKRPFRCPNNGITHSALCGGGSPIKIGEISLSHRGILFLDEFLEFKRNVIESLRAPMEDGKICISRVNETLELPCDFLLVGAFNPCPCGFLNDEYKNCKCSPYEIKKYMSNLSGPILDRFDLQIHLKRVNYDDLRSLKKEESSEEILKRVVKARKIQAKRFGSDTKLNSSMTVEEIKKYCALNQESEEKLQTAYQKMNLSARSLNSILKVARTIADLDESKEIQTKHLLEAIQYRRIDIIFERYH